MSKTMMLWAVAGLVVIVGGYFALTANKAPIGDGAAENTTAEQSGKKMAFSEFIKKGEASKCTVTQNVNGTETNGVTYIGNGMIRGEYNMKVQGMNVDSTLIVRDGYTYSWSSMMPTTGFKVKVSGAAQGDANAAASGQYSFNAEQIGDYSCEPWTVDESKFAVPAGVTFREL